MRWIFSQPLGHTSSCSPEAPVIQRRGNVLRWSRARDGHCGIDAGLRLGPISDQS
jgi:hypothetical protein